jgi:hypothetical protein
MGLFGNDEQQDQRLEELERQVRRLVEEVHELTIDLGVTRMELLKARLAADDAVRAEDIDPLIRNVDALLADSRDQVDQASAAADDSWKILRAGSDESLRTLRVSIEDAWARLGAELDADGG